VKSRRVLLLLVVALPALALAYAVPRFDEIVLFD
jgi:hypothetical protein